MKGQLTGVPRQIKDSVADIYNLIQKWKKLNLQGFEQLTRVSDIKLSLFVSIKSSNDVRYTAELNEACAMLVQTFKDMKVISKRLSDIFLKFNKLTEIASFNSSLGNTSNDIPFTSWPISQFVDYAKEIAEMYAKELSVKECIVESAAHVDHKHSAVDVAALSEKCRDILTTYSSCWLHEPYINETTKEILIEGLLFETGHSN